MAIYFPNQLSGRDFSEWKLVAECDTLYFDFCVAWKIRVVLSKGYNMLYYSLTVINICWAHKAYKPILGAFPIDILLVHLMSLLQTVRNALLGTV